MGDYLRKGIWDALLTADMNTRVWDSMCNRYYAREKAAKIFLAITTSGTVAGWSIWLSVAPVWQVMSGISTIIAIVLPILNWSKAIKDTTELKKDWAELLYQLKALWVKYHEMPDDQKVFESYEQYTNKLSVVVGRETGLNPDKKLIERCYQEVLQTTGATHGD